VTNERRHPLDVERLVTTLARHDVRYLVVGGIAAILHGWPGATADFDLLGAFETANLERLSGALRELGAIGAGWDGTAATMASHTTWSLETEAGPVDVLFVLEPRGTYDELRPRAEEVSAFGVVIPVVSLEDLIELKASLGRPKDLRVAVELEELRRQRGR
jgi:predicted nucleotidyltransferase